MHSNLQPWQIPLAALAGWVNRHQQHIIEYFQGENRVLKEQVRVERLQLLSEVATLLTPDTIMAWRQKLRVMKWDYSLRRKTAGRPRVQSRCP